MRKIICKIFGCSWRYFFTLSDSYIQRVDVRNCICCGKTQQYKQLATFGDEDEFAWMTMVGYTKVGAEKHWTLKYNLSKKPCDGKSV